MSRVTWKDERNAAEQPVLRGYVGDIPSYTLRNRADGRVNLTDRLQQTMVIHDTEVGAKKAAENALRIFMERIGAQFVDPERVVLGAATGRIPRSLTATRRKVLQNVADGNELYHGMVDAERETAIRFVTRWREFPSLVRHVGIGNPLELTDAGRKALETGEY